VYRSPLDLVAAILVIIGGINWGLVGAFDFNLVQEIFGSGTVADIIYIIVGLAAIYLLVALFARRDEV